MLVLLIFMLSFSLFGMLGINSMMKTALKKHEQSNIIHSQIYAGLINRYQSLFKLVNGNTSTTDTGKIQALINEIYQERKKLIKNQSLCIHNKNKPINPIFVKQAAMLSAYKKLEDQVIELVKQGENYKAFLLFSNELLKQKENTLKQILRGNKYIQTQSADEIQKINDQTIYSIAFYGFINMILIALGLYFSVHILRQYISKNKELTDSSRLDLLTNLSNRLHFLEEINRQILEKPNSSFAVAFIDIDYFKSINDIYGHTLADSLLVQFGKVLSSQLKGVNHCIARFGGDEFVLLIRDINRKKTDALMKKISTAVNTNYYSHGQKIGLTSSIGVAMYPDDATTTKMLLHKSDLAMYQAKKTGRACYRLFSNKLVNTVLVENEISQRLQTSLSNKKNIYLLYQPLLNTETYSVSDCEALLRWNDPKHGEVSPETFIQIAEKTNLIRSVNYFVIDEVCKQQRKWAKDGNYRIRVNINLAGNQQIFTASLKRLIEKIQKYDLSPFLFGIEITEGSLFEINDLTINQLRIANRMGIKISIDDFGTGYSSLLYLAKLPLTTLKIDKAFISNLCDREKDNTIVLSIIKLGQSLGLDIVAEGVETYNQCEYLKLHSCNIIQGYLFSKPISAEELEHLEIPDLKTKSQAQNYRIA